MLIIFVPSDEDEVSEDPRPVPRKSKKKYGKVIQHFFDLTSWSYILIYDPCNVLARARLIFGEVAEYPSAKTGA